MRCYCILFTKKNMIMLNFIARMKKHEIFENKQNILNKLKDMMMLNIMKAEHYPHSINWSTALLNL